MLQILTHKKMQNLGFILSISTGKSTILNVLGKIRLVICLGVFIIIFFFGRWWEGYVLGVIAAEGWLRSQEISTAEFSAIRLIMDSIISIICYLLFEIRKSP